MERRIDGALKEFQGKRLFVVGSGPSLDTHDLDLLRPHHVWALNAAAVLFADRERFREAAWMFRDRRAISQVVPRLKGWKRWRVITTDKCYAQIEHEAPYAVVSAYTYPEAWVVHERTVAEDAIQMAKKAGFADVVLVGVDCSVPAGRPYAESLMWKPCSWYDVATPVAESKACASMLQALRNLAGRLGDFPVWSTSRTCDAFPYIDYEAALVETVRA